MGYIKDLRYFLSVNSLLSADFQNLAEQYKRLTDNYALQQGRVRYSFLDWCVEKNSSLFFKEMNTEDFSFAYGTLGAFPCCIGAYSARIGDKGENMYMERVWKYTLCRTPMELYVLIGKVELINYLCCCQTFLEGNIQRFTITEERIMIKKYSVDGHYFFGLNGIGLNAIFQTPSQFLDICKETKNCGVEIDEIINTIYSFPLLSGLNIIL